MMPSLSPLVLPAGRRAAVLAAFLLVLLPACGGGVGVGNNNDNCGNCNDNGTGDGGVTPDADLCGEGDDEKDVSAKPRIYNGTEAPSLCMSPRQQQAVGALTFEDYRWENACTGTLVADDVVVTAAHCTQDWWHNELHPNQVRFVLGHNALTPDKTFSVAEVHAHPDYAGEADHDVGVLVLTDGVLDGNDVLPIPANTAALPQSLVGTWVQQGGYGSTQDNEDNHLRWWSQLEEITQILPGEFIVYGQGVSSVCYGDSGGPSLHLFGGETLRLIGNVSWGDESCVDYDHFARTDDNQDFIEGYTGTVDPCFGIDAQGMCDGDVAVWCEGGELKQQCCGAQNLACTQNNAGEFRCENQCGSLTWEGECLEGNVAQWCDGGHIKQRHCEPCAQVCGWAGDVLGNYCVDP